MPFNGPKSRALDRTRLRGLSLGPTDPTGPGTNSYPILLHFGAINVGEECPTNQPRAQIAPKATPASIEPSGFRSVWLPLRELIARIPLRFASLGLFLELLQFLSLLGARISIPFRALLAIVRPECHVIFLFASKPL